MMHLVHTRCWRSAELQELWRIGTSREGPPWIRCLLFFWPSDRYTIQEILSFLHAAHRLKSPFRSLPSLLFSSFLGG